MKEVRKNLQAVRDELVFMQRQIDALKNIIDETTEILFDMEMEHNAAKEYR